MPFRYSFSASKHFNVRRKPIILVSNWSSFDSFSHGVAFEAISKVRAGRSVPAATVPSPLPPAPVPGPPPPAPVPSQPPPDPLYEDIEITWYRNTTFFTTVATLCTHNNTLILLKLMWCSDFFLLLYYNKMILRAVWNQWTGRNTGGMTFGYVVGNFNEIHTPHPLRCYPYFMFPQWPRKGSAAWDPQSEGGGGLNNDFSMSHMHNLQSFAGWRQLPKRGVKLSLSSHTPHGECSSLVPPNY